LTEGSRMRGRYDEKPRKDELPRTEHKGRQIGMHYVYKGWSLLQQMTLQPQSNYAC